MYVNISPPNCRARTKRKKTNRTKSQKTRRRAHQAQVPAVTMTVTVDNRAKHATNATYIPAKETYVSIKEPYLESLAKNENYGLKILLEK